MRIYDIWENVTTICSDSEGDTWRRCSRQKPRGQDHSACHIKLIGSTAPRSTETTSLPANWDPITALAPKKPRSLPATSLHRTIHHTLRTLVAQVIVMTLGFLK
jgi:hypothetical protein